MNEKSELMLMKRATAAVSFLDQLIVVK